MKEIRPLLPIEHDPNYLEFAQQVLARQQGALEAWEKSCEDCAVKRGWMSEIQSLDQPFICVHRTADDQSIMGEFKACASVKHKVKKWNESF